MSQSPQIQRVALALTVVSLLLCIWGLDRWSKPLPCINSVYVDSFHIQSGEILDEVPRCRLSSLWASSLPLSNEQISQIDDKLENLGSWTHEFGDFVAPVRLFVSFNKPLELKISAVNVEIGVDLLSSHGQLVRAFLRAWMLQRMPSYKHRSPLEQDIMIDLALSHVQGELHLTSPVSSQAGDYHAQHWFHLLQSWQSLCHSVWGTALEQCGDINHGAPDEGRQARVFSVWSLRPLIGSLFWQTYQNLPLVIKARFFDQWMRYQMAQASSEMTTSESIGDPWMARIFDFQGRAHTSAIYTTFVDETERLGLSGDVTLEKFWSQSLRQVLTRAEYTSDVNQISSHLYIRSEEAAFRLTDFSDILEVATNDPQRLAVIANHYDHYILPSVEPVELVMDSGNIFERWVWQTCSDFDLKTILRDSVEAHRILLVDRCSQVDPVRYQPLIVAGVEAFAHHNPVTAFVDIQPTALFLAAQLTRSDLDKIQWKWVEPQNHVNSVEGLMGLFQPKWSEFGQAYQVNGAVEGISWYRGPHPSMRPELN
jgi:hypothetical protein